MTKQQDIRPAGPVKRAWKRFRRNRLAMLALIFLLLEVVVALLANGLANQHPLSVTLNGETHYPVFSERNDTYLDGEKAGFVLRDWKRDPNEGITFPLIPYTPGFSDRFNGFLNARYVSPFGDQRYLTAEGDTIDIPLRYRHWMGTGRLGEDVAAGVIHGTRQSLLIGWLSMLLAGLLGIGLGALAGYFGDHGLRVRRGQLMVWVAGVFFAWFFGYFVRRWQLSAPELADSTDGRGMITAMLILGLALAVGRWAPLGRWGNRLVRIRLDFWVQRGMEIFHSVPRLVLILVLVALVQKPSIWSVILIIGLTSWTGVARLVRAEFLRVREEGYVQAGRALGLTPVRIMLRHALPNAIGPAIVALAFGVGSAILLESGLSFLGIGVPEDEVTWGSLLKDGQQKFQAWWLVVFPGLALFFTVAALNLVGEGLRDALDPREQRMTPVLAEDEEE